MVVSSVRRKLTYEDFVRFPEDGLRHEILDGVHVASPAPAPWHQQVVLALALPIGNYLEANPIGRLYLSPIDVRLSKHDVVEPDLVYLSGSKLWVVGPVNLQGAPSLAIEVLSPSSRRRDLGTKRVRYQRLGVEEYWVVDPEGYTTTVFRRRDPQDPRFEPPILLSAEAGEVLSTPLFPGLAIPLRKVFAR